MSESFNYIILKVRINSRIKFFKITLENKFFIKEFSLSMQFHLRKKERISNEIRNAGDKFFKKLWIFYVTFLSIHFLFRCILQPFIVSINILYQDFSTFVHWIKKFSRIDACESKVEIVTPYWASNSAGKIRAIVNTQHFEQAIHQEVCS